MATIQRIEGKNSGSYKITVHCGYDHEYRKIRHYKTWRVPDGWSVKRADREAQKIALEFEQSLSQGYLLDNRQTFREYVEAAGISHTTVTAACRGERILQEKAEQISKGLNENFANLFEAEQSDSNLSAKTIKEYHRFIRVVLGQAEREMLVPYNAAAKATPPKSKSPEPNFFQPHEIAEILEALESEPLKWRTITHLLLVTGCRRGEIMGLKWSKIDLSEQRIKIDSNLLYSKERGVYEGPTKTENVRFLQIPKETVALLGQYRAGQEEMKRANGDRWNDLDFVFTQDDGRPMNPSSITA